MLQRKEISGLHLYDRVSGLHALLDDVPVSPEVAVEVGPRHLSLMLTDECGLSCPYCYVNRGTRRIEEELVFAVAAAADELQVLDLTLGGGEPAMHPQFPRIAEQLWVNHSFGLSVTTHGLLQEPLIDAAPFLSSVRISIDNSGKPLTERTAGLMAKLAAQTHVGVNLLVPPGDQDWIAETLRRLEGTGAADVLILPQHDRGAFLLSAAEWALLDRIVPGFRNISFSITAGAGQHSSLPTLDTAHPDEFLFAHIDVRGGIHEYCWGPEVARGTTADELAAQLRSMNPIRRRSHESLV